ncbi:hypothetical protein [Leifsonia sp. Leaf264]|uniref:hypothetical protein n=1 Tax=Leifsonia sp. Leaf264 TaxID=1736314 RepID=UPI0006F3DB8B|nr:hypothetical protein [Leifsonia sp. Leaf264]KQP01421.1 hypothetical protein ASF30_02045 [Leifsonia sp. Leaf264]
MQTTTTTRRELEVQLKEAFTLVEPRPGSLLEYRIEGVLGRDTPVELTVHGFRGAVAVRTSVAEIEIASYRSSVDSYDDVETAITRVADARGRALAMNLWPPRREEAAAQGQLTWLGNGLNNDYYREQKEFGRFDSAAEQFDAVVRILQVQGGADEAEARRLAGFRGLRHGLTWWQIRQLHVGALSTTFETGQHGRGSDDFGYGTGFWVLGAMATEESATPEMLATVTERMTETLAQLGKTGRVEVTHEKYDGARDPLPRITVHVDDRWALGTDAVSDVERVATPYATSGYIPNFTVGFRDDDGPFTWHSIWRPRSTAETAGENDVDNF